MRTTRFERKIVVAFVVVGLAPLLAALLLGRAALREAYGVGVNDQIRGELDDALSLYTEHLKSLRAQAEQTAALVATDTLLGLDIAAGDRVAAEARLERLLDSYPAVAQAHVRRGPQDWLTVTRAGRLQDARYRHLVLPEPVAPLSETVVEVTALAPWAPFRAHERLAKTVAVYDALERESDAVSAGYLYVFSGFLFLVIVASVGIGIVLARRVTGRVAVLAEATRRVGAGDLSVQVPADNTDEVGELSTAFNHMVRDLKESQTRIEYLQRIGAWQQFARRLAHEIKNPLTPIQLAVQEMHTSYAGGDPRYQRKLDDARAIVEEEIATLRRLVGEFTNFAKLPTAELQAFDLVVFVTDLEKGAQAILEDEASRMGARPAVTVRFEVPKGPIPARIDPMMLRRGVDNLIRNAVEACRGRGPAEVLVRLETQGKQALIEVHDGGPGLPAAERERVFDPYFTTKAEGTGLGLPIVKKVVLEHGGEIETGASPLGGARFRITLPVRS